MYGRNYGQYDNKNENEKTDDAASAKEESIRKQLENNSSE